MAGRRTASCGPDSAPFQANLRSFEKCRAGLFGAPLIGVVGAFGLVLSVKKIRTHNLAEAQAQLRKWADALIQTRPTGVNLRWAVERVFDASAKAKDVP